MSHCVPIGIFLWVWLMQNVHSLLAVVLCGSTYVIYLFYDDVYWCALTEVFKLLLQSYSISILQVRRLKSLKWLLHDPMLRVSTYLVSPFWQVFGWWSFQWIAVTSVYQHDLKIFMLTWFTREVILLGMLLQMWH